MKKIRVFIVDDHKMVREGLRSLLQDDPDVKVVGEAENGEKALECLATLHSDIILLDLKMPGIDGIEVCRQICAQYPDTAVIGLTTFEDENIACQLIQAGAKGYVLKDVEGLQLQQILRTVVSGESVIDPKIVERLTHQAPELKDRKRDKGDLTNQQLTILRLIGQGLSNKEIANQMGLSEYTIKSYIQDLLSKIGARNRVEAAMIASREGWI